MDKGEVKEDKEKEHKTVESVEGREVRGGKV